VTPFVIDQNVTVWVDAGMMPKLYSVMNSTVIEVVQSKKLKMKNTFELPGCSPTQMEGTPNTGRIESPVGALGRGSTRCAFSC